LDFHFVHVYSKPTVDAKAVASAIKKVFPKCKVDVRKPFFEHWNADARVVEFARISDTKQPFEKQPKTSDQGIPLYDGFALQRLLAERISDKERHADHLHIILTDLLTCTFDEEDWRYHGRAVVCGTPSVVSTASIVEAPAKPREFYMAQMAGFADMAKRQFVGRFIDYGDSRMTTAASIYSLQAAFFFATGGEPFCNNKNCLLFNAHWQEDLIRIIAKPKLCSKHARLADKFNKNK
jgi:hypothetical protein